MQKLWESIFSLILLGAIVVAYTKDDLASLDAPETAAIITSIIVDYEAVNPILNCLQEPLTMLPMVCITVS